MRLRKWNPFCNLRGDARGSEIAETAMILPLFFMIFMAIFWFGEAFSIYGTLAHATRLGAEAAVEPGCTTCAATLPPTNAQTAVHNALIASHLSTNNLVPWGGATPKWTAPPLCTCNSTVTTGCTAPPCNPSISDVCVQENVQLSSAALGGLGTCGTSVSVRYQIPFSLPIPLTTLNLDNFLLPGQAQMRVETQ